MWKTCYSTNAGIAPEVVNKQCGWLIPRTTESLISALEDSFSKINKLQSMGVEAFISVEERVADWSAMYYEKMFDHVWDRNERISRKKV